MLSGIPAQRLWRGRPTTSTTSSSTRNDANTELSTDQSLRSIAEIRSSEEAELDSLNSSLACLTSVFPDVQPEVFREMLSTFSQESRLQLVTECLLKHKGKWVKGRWRIVEPRKTGATDIRSAKAEVDEPLVPRKERFRSADYKLAVKEALYQEFRTLSHSTIKAILAEHNFSYTDSRRALLALLSKSWRVSVTNLLLRRKMPSLEECPLVKWEQSSAGTAQPVLIQTRSKELNDELKADIVTPLMSKQLDQQLENDMLLADKLNEEEADANEALFECQCCFIPNTFERISACDVQGHYICFRCIRNAVNEALFGQGWASSISNSKCSVNCIALAGSESSCTGCLPRDSVRRALFVEGQGFEIWQKFEDRTSKDMVSHTQLPLSACPFCPYAEISEPVSTLYGHRKLAELYRYLPVLILSVLIFPFNPIIGIIILGLAFTHYRRRMDRKKKDDSTFYCETSGLRILNFGQKFVCRNPSCSRSSCLNCLAPWIDTHICHQSSRQALRTYIESAVTEAIKRTCPKCNLSFVKSSGCNKLVCNCGYSMCYVCRQDLSKEGYAHFCQHFRTNPGQTCDECDRCDLYRTEDDDEVISKAKKNAITAWKEQRQGSDEYNELAEELGDEDFSADKALPKKRMRWLFE